MNNSQSSAPEPSPELVEGLAEIPKRDLETARRIRDAIARHFVGALNADCLFEVSLANRRRADIMALSPSGEIWIVEVKSSHADYRSDNKWTEYLDYCDRYWFATNERFDPALLDGVLTDERVGHFITDGFEVFERQASAVDKLSAARRKAVLTRFAGLAARRLYWLGVQASDSEA